MASRVGIMGRLVCEAGRTELSRKQQSHEDSVWEREGSGRVKLTNASLKGESGREAPGAAVLNLPNTATLQFLML